MTLTYKQNVKSLKLSPNKHLICENAASYALSLHKGNGQSKVYEDLSYNFYPSAQIFIKIKYHGTHAINYSKKA